MSGSTSLQSASRCRPLQAAVQTAGQPQISDPCLRRVLDLASSGQLDSTGWREEVASSGTSPTDATALRKDAKAVKERLATWQELLLGLRKALWQQEQAVAAQQAGVDAYMEELLR